MKEWEAERLIAGKTRENSLILPGSVVFGLWNRETGHVTITDEIPVVSEQIRLGHDVIRVYADGWELEPIGRRYGEYGEMVHMNRELLWRIRSM